MSGLHGVSGTPQEGEPSYPLYKQERTELLASLKRRAQKLHKTLEGLEGVTCTIPEGSLYAMPRIRLPAGAVEVRAQQFSIVDAAQASSTRGAGGQDAQLKAVSPCAG